MEFMSSPWFFILIVAMAIWDIAWKLPALWKSARRNQMAWFICIGVINTIGLLPIIYLLTNRRKDG